MSDRIMIIDDNTEVSSSLEKYLTNIGLDTRIVRQKDDVVSEVKNYNPTAILLDVINPGEKGFELLKKLKESEETSSIPVILNSFIDDYQEEGLRLGAVDFIRKPIKKESLFNSIIKILKKRDMSLDKAVLVIDDDPNIIEVTKDYLGNRNIKVIGATDGVSGISIVQNKNIGLILLDLNMPGMDGYSVIKILKDNPITCDIPIIILTSIDVEECRDKCIMLGADECFTKPFTGETLLNEVKTFLGRAQSRRPKFQDKIKARVLIADDEDIIRELIIDTLEEDGYDLIIAKDGKEALEKIYSEHPDILILDLKMPYFDGFQVCEKVREDVLMANLPIIMLTAKGTEADEVRGFEIGVDEYLTKPFRPAILSARVRAAFLRIQQGLDVNPLTYLPGNTSIERDIERRLKRGDDFAVLYIDIDRFKAYNDYYGFHQGDDIIKLTARILVDSAKLHNPVSAFVGHIGGDDFICIIDEDKIDFVCEEIIERFDSEIIKHYDKSDVERGFITIENRRGIEETFPLVAVSIGVVTTSGRGFEHIGQIAKIGVELKKYAKKNINSNFVLDRRID